jgi:hypothetical protein
MEPINLPPPAHSAKHLSNQQLPQTSYFSQTVSSQDQRLENPNFVPDSSLQAICGQSSIAEVRCLVVKGDTSSREQAIGNNPVAIQSPPNQLSTPQPSQLLDPSLVFGGLALVAFVSVVALVLGKEISLSGATNDKLMEFRVKGSATSGQPSKLAKSKRRKP